MPESKPKRRWYHLSPDRLIIGLLAVEGFLLLSEWFQWFAFNEKKGWTVLIAVAAVCLVVVVMLLWLAASLLFRLRFQLSLRSLVVLVVAVGIPLGWLSVKMREAERQKRAVEAIEKAGGHVWYDYQLDGAGMLIAKQGTPAPAWAMKLVDVDFLSDVTGVAFYFPTEAGDEVLVHVKALTELKRLELCSTHVTDAGLENLKGLTGLRRLAIYRQQVTDVGLQKLKGLRELEWVGLSGTRVSDAGLENLVGWTKLKRLALCGTQVTEERIERLRMSFPMCNIYGPNWLSTENSPQDQP